MNKTLAPQDNQTAWLLVFAAFIISLAATMGSLFFSEVMAVPVCKLCWYQRVALYPLVVVFAIGLFPYERRLMHVASVLVAGGWLIGLFQLLVIADVIPEKVQPCLQGIPCSDTHILLFGFVNIPMLSFFTFSLIGALLYFAHRTEPS